MERKQVNLTMSTPIKKDSTYGLHFYKSSTEIYPYDFLNSDHFYKFIDELNSKLESTTKNIVMTKNDAHTISDTGSTYRISKEGGI